MISNSKTKKYYTINLEIDVEHLTQAYLEGTELTEPDSIPSMIKHEMHWVLQSGIETVCDSVKEISN